MLRSHYGLQQYLRGVAQSVWRDQDEARHYGLKLQEETITEMLLLRMARECNHLGLKVKMFNRIEEGGDKRTGKAGNGADWEWYVTTPFCQVGFRVQAKVLSSDVNSSSGLLDPGKYAGLLAGRAQTKALIDDAARSGWNPIYVFYNHPWISDRALFSSSHHPFQVMPGDWGCAVATAKFVQATPGNRLLDMLTGMRPWHRFFGWERGCISLKAMSEMPGDQEFIRETPRPDWLGLMNDGEEALNRYLFEHRLQGVAHIDFSDFEG